MAVRNEDNQIYIDLIYYNYMFGLGMLSWGWEVELGEEGQG